MGVGKRDRASRKRKQLERVQGGRRAGVEVSLGGFGRGEAGGQ